MKKLLPCLFLHDVKVCSHRKTENSDVMHHRVKCMHFKTFNEGMESAEDEFFEEVERLGKLSGADFCCICARRLDFDNRSNVRNVCRRCLHTLEM